MLISKRVKLRWNSKNKSNYIDKGYLFSSLGDEFEVDIKDLSKGSKANVKVKCDYCGKEQEIMYLGYNKSLNGIELYKCKSCANKGIAENNKNSYQDVKKEFEKRGYILLDKEYKDTHTLMKYICPKHKEKGCLTIQYNNLKSGYGCPYCAKSKGELKILSYLDKIKVKYKQEFIINDCKDNKYLPFDFALFDVNSNLICLVEYDGEPHYKPSRRKNSNSVLESIRKHDDIKNEYCKNNDIKLFRIPYWEYDNIENIMNKIIKSSF
jgi:transposase-like protein